MPDKFTDKPVHVLTRHLTLDIPSETADVLGELQRNPEPLPELPDGSGPSFPEPTGQTHGNGFNGKMRDSCHFGDFRHTQIEAKIAPESPNRRKKTHLAQNKKLQRSQSLSKSLLTDNLKSAGANRSTKNCPEVKRTGQAEPVAPYQLRLTDPALVNTPLLRSLLKPRTRQGTPCLSRASVSPAIDLLRPFPPS